MKNKWEDSYNQLSNALNRLGEALEEDINDNEMFLESVKK